MKLKNINVGDIVLLGLNIPNSLVEVEKIDKEKNLIIWHDGDTECSCIPEFVNKVFGVGDSFVDPFEEDDVYEIVKVEKPNYFCEYVGNDLKKWGSKKTIRYNKETFRFSEV